jgi:hypothetical protein
MKCKSGRHEWINPEDAAKCCNGYRRVLEIGNVRSCDRIVTGALPGDVAYGYRWEPVNDVVCTTEQGHEGEEGE